MNGRGQSEVLGSLLLVAVVVAMVAGVSVLVLNAVTPGGDAPRATFEGEVTVDRVAVSHVAGADVPLDAVTVVLRHGAGPTRYAPGPANVTGDGDGDFAVGERWARDHGLSLSAGDRVALFVVHEPTEAVLYEGALVVRP